MRACSTYQFPLTITSLHCLFKAGLLSCYSTSSLLLFFCIWEGSRGSNSVESISVLKAQPARWNWGLTFWRHFKCATHQWEIWKAASGSKQVTERSSTVIKNVCKIGKTEVQDLLSPRAEHEINHIITRTAKKKILAHYGTVIVEKALCDAHFMCNTWHRCCGVTYQACHASLGSIALAYYYPHCAGIMSGLLGSVKKKPRQKKGLCCGGIAPSLCKKG